MNMTHRNGLRRLAGLALMTGVLGLTGCDLDEILSVTDRDRVTPDALEPEDVTDIVVTGARGDFTTAFSGGDSYVTVSALITDEFFSSGTFTTRTATDRRNQFPAQGGNTSDGPYVDLQQARRSLKDAAQRVADFEGTSEADFVELKALEGYTMVLLGEGYCSAVPLSGVNEEGVFVYGPPLSTAELLDTAIAKFDASLAGDPTDLAAVGKARALLDLGQYDAAAAAVAGVPTDFNYFVLHSESAIQNPIFGLQGNGRYSQSDLEGGNDTGLPFRNPEDPRAPWTEDPDGGFDPAFRLFLSNKYNNVGAPIVLASGVEARLIEAEAELQADDFVGMTVILNDLRAQVEDIMLAWVSDYQEVWPSPDEDYTSPTLAPLAPPATFGAARDMLFSERAFWLFLTGHRLGDARRLIYQYDVAEDQAYPSGSYHKGGSHGDDVVFPLDFDEENNPVFKEEGGHSLCVVTSADITR